MLPSFRYKTVVGETSTWVIGAEDKAGTMRAMILMTVPDDDDADDDDDYDDDDTRCR